MNLEEFNRERNLLNQRLTESDEFFGIFGSLDDKVYSEGAIPKKYKELTGLSISIFSKCQECIAYHLQNCKKENCTKDEVARLQTTIRIIMAKIKLLDSKKTLFAQLRLLCRNIQHEVNMVLTEKFKLEAEEE